MKLSQFKFKLPEELIAQEPVAARDECKLMVLHKKTGEIEHKIFKEIINYFDEGDVMVFNDTLVFPAKLYGRRRPVPVSRVSCFASLTRRINCGMFW